MPSMVISPLCLYRMYRQTLPHGLNQGSGQKPCLDMTALLLNLVQKIIRVIGPATVHYDETALSCSMITDRSWAAVSWWPAW